MKRPSRADLVAAAWACAALAQARRHLRRRRVTDVRVRPPPASARTGQRAVRRVLRSGRATCLERSMVVQAWEAAQGRGRDLVIGVTSRAEGFRAHAWLDGEPEEHHGDFQELLRLPPRPAD